MATFSDFHVFSSSKGFPPAFIRLREPAIFCFFLSFWNDMGSFNRRECVGGHTHRSRQIAINGSAVSQSTRSQTYSNDGARLKEDPPPPIIKYWRHCFFVFYFSSHFPNMLTIFLTPLGCANTIRLRSSITRNPGSDRAIKSIPAQWEKWSTTAIRNGKRYDEDNQKEKT